MEMRGYYFFLNLNRRRQTEAHFGETCAGGFPRYESFADGLCCF